MHTLRLRADRIENMKNLVDSETFVSISMNSNIISKPFTHSSHSLKIYVEFNTKIMRTIHFPAPYRQFFFLCVRCFSFVQAAASLVKFLEETDGL